MPFIEEAQRSTEIKAEYDVIVAGGGIAGISAALAAARGGAKTLLIERQYMLGGLATLGLVTIYLPLCDGCGRQVSFGIAEELLRLSIRHGYEGKYPASWLEDGDAQGRKKQRFEVQYSANIFSILCEQLLRESGVELLYGSAVCDAVVADGSISALVVENKSGRGAYLTKSVIDCTGDADVARQCGAPTAQFSQKNVLAGWYYYQQADRVRLKMLGFADIPDKYKTENDSTAGLPRYAGLEADELTEMTLNSHRFLLDDFLKDGALSEQHALTSVATIPQVRMTRRIVGDYTMDDNEMHKEFSDSIGLVSDWRKSGPVYEIPFSTLHSSSVKNLAFAGRCISVTDAMWDITRVIPVCAVTGQAVGTAAALNPDFTELSISQLQQQLTADGVVLHENQLN